MGGSGHHHHHHHHHHGDVLRPACAGQAEGTDHKPREKVRLWMAVAVTATTMVVEVIGGLWTGSLALLSDAGHMLTHASALGVSLAAILFAGRKASVDRTFGNYRAEVLAALFNAVTLLLITLLIIQEAWLRLQEPLPVMGWQMFAVALVGLAVNLLTAWLLHDVGREDINVRGAFLHMLGDTLSSLVVVGGAVVIALTDAYWIDPLLSVLVCIVILYWAWGLTRESVRVLMESAPAHLAPAEVKALLSIEPEIIDVLDLHLFTITSGMHVLEARLKVSGDSDLRRLSEAGDRLRHELAHQFGIGHVTLEWVPADD